MTLLAVVLILSITLRKVSNISVGQLEIKKGANKNLVNNQVALYIYIFNSPLLMSKHLTSLIYTVIGGKKGQRVMSSYIHTCKKRSFCFSFQHILIENGRKTEIRIRLCLLNTWPIYTKCVFLNVT